MNFDFDNAGREAQHIERFMGMAQEYLEDLQPIPEGKMRRVDALYSLLQISERIASELVAQMEAAALKCCAKEVGNNGI